MGEGLDVTVLRGVEARRGGARIAVPGVRLQALLTMLALSVPGPVSDDRLIDEIWGDEPPANPANALQALVSQLRRVLGRDVVLREGSGYRLAVAPGDVDALRLEQLVTEGRRAAADGDPGAAIERFTAALAFVRGPVLVHFADREHGQRAAARLDELVLAAHEGLADALLATGRHHEVVTSLTQLVAEHPLRERLRAQLILALYRSGRQADALRAYQDARTALVDELGIDPGPELQALERAVLAQDPTLDLPLAAPARPDDAAPATAPTAEPGRTSSGPLPVPLTPIVGREVELATVGALLRGNRLVTLTGPGGAGKTTLALAVARAWGDDEEVWFVDLGALADAERVADTVAAAIGLPSTPDEDPAASVARALVRERGLVILDTCEHVLLTTASLVLRVLGACPGVRVLATSRRPFGITGETAWPVPPLAVPPPGARYRDVATFPAATLFCDRARAVRPDFELTDANADDVATICQTLDGLPLAIELAAARADVLTPAAIRGRLQDRFGLLVDGGRQAAARQQTLRAAIDWSFDLLDDDARTFFVRLGAFAGSFDLDAAIAVAGVGLRDPLSLLAALVRHSMVVTAGEDRYRLLDSLRAYAGESLPLDDPAHRAHAHHYAALAGQAERGLLRSDEPAWLARVRADVPNFRAAVEWSLLMEEGEQAGAIVGSLGWFWTLEGMLAEAVDLAERAAALTGLSPLVRSKVLTCAALLAASLGRLDDARPAAAEGAALAEQHGDAFAAARALHALAITEWAVGEYDAAIAAHDRAIAGLAGRTEPWVLGRLGLCMAMRARSLRDAGEADTAPLLADALATARRSGAQDVTALVLEQIARERLAADDPGAAVEAARECLAAHETMGYTEGIMAALHVLAQGMTAVGSMDEAKALHLRALGLSDRIGHAAGTCEALEGLALVASTDDDHVTALTLVEVSAASREEHGLTVRVPDDGAVEAVRAAAEVGLGPVKSAEVTGRARLRALPDVVAALLADGAPA